jgi:hypothetical protein
MRRLLRTALLGIGLIAVLLVVCLMVAILTGFHS